MPMPNYKVDVSYVDSTGSRTSYMRAFSGERAFDEAEEFFQLMKNDSINIELDYLRYDGREWHFVTEPIRRNKQGQWEPIPGYHPPAPTP
jgi:hypothetical protein